MDHNFSPEVHHIQCIIFKLYMKAATTLHSYWKRCHTSQRSQRATCCDITGRRDGGGDSEVVENLQHRGQRPGLCLTAERAVLAVLVGQFRQTPPRRPEKGVAQVTSEDPESNTDRRRRRLTGEGLTAPDGCNVWTKHFSPW